MENYNPPPHYHVVVGLIENDQQQMLVSKRLPHALQGDLWEFPGGKIESNENHFSALCRELREEIDIHVIDAAHQMSYDYDYKDYSVTIHVWRVNQYHGVPYGAEGQKVKWVNRDRLTQLPFVFGNANIIKGLVSNEWAL